MRKLRKRYKNKKNKKQNKIITSISFFLILSISLMKIKKKRATGLIQMQMGLDFNPFVQKLLWNWLSFCCNVYLIEKKLY